MQMRTLLLTPPGGEGWLTTHWRDRGSGFPFFKPLTFEIQPAIPFKSESPRSKAFETTTAEGWIQIC
jgi:hypothetical protein